MKYFITGSGGFIGKTLCQHLEKEGQTVIKFNRHTDSFEVLNDCDVVVHLSAYGNHYSQTDPIATIKANILDLADMLTLAKYSDKLRLFYNISSSSVTLPIQTMYSSSKLFGETMVNNMKDARFINVRPYSVYGPGEAAHRFIPTIIRCLNSGEKMQLDPDAKHDWIFIDDFIKSLLFGQTEIGTGEGRSNMQVVRMLEEISGKKLNFEIKKLRSFDNDNWVCPNGVPHISIYEGLKQTYESA